MNATVAKIRDASSTPPVTGLAKLREPFPDHQVSKLPKPTKAQTDEVKADFKKGVRCAICGAWHHPQVVHLDYVGHAALTDRLLDTDPEWSWEPLAYRDGLPAFDATGGLWIKLTVCGVSRLGYGHAATKPNQDPGAREKEIIGDCLLAGTPIQTARGAVPIEDVRVGDMVPTRHGWRKVTDHWLSHRSAPTRAVLLSDGRFLIGTPHHRIPTTNAEKRIDALRNGDMLYIWQDTENTQARVISSGADEFTAARPTTPTDIGAPTSWRQPLREPICIATSMMLAAALSRRDGISTTSTTTRSTTASTTSPRLAPRLMQPCTGQNSSALGSGVTSVESRSSLSEIAPDGVRPPVKSVGGARTALLTRAPKNPSLTIDNAPNADVNSSLRNRGRVSVQVSVVAVLDAGRGEVWNLSVEGVHEYVANGVVVNNSLRNAAMRFGAALDLWHKGDLHVADAAGEDADAEPETPLWIVAAKTAITCLETEDACGTWYKANLAELKTRPQPERDGVLAYLKARKTALKPLPPRDDPNPLGATPMMAGDTPFDDDLSVLGDDKVPF